MHPGTQWNPWPTWVGVTGRTQDALRRCDRALGVGWPRQTGNIQARHLIADQPAASIAAASVGMAERPDSTPDLAGIDVPALVITSTGDTLIPPDVSSPMAGQIPGARLEVIEGPGHLSNLEAPEEFNRLLELHLERCGILG